MIDKCKDENFVSNVLGGVFIAVAILGFLPNPIVGAHGFFVTNGVHNVVHALLGIALIAGAKAGYGKKTLLGVGIVYTVVAILGYITMGKSDMLFGLVKLNMADHYLHLLLGGVVIGAGLYVKGKK